MQRDRLGSHASDTFHYDAPTLRLLIRAAKSISAGGEWKLVKIPTSPLRGISHSLTRKCFTLFPLFLFLFLSLEMSIQQSIITFYPTVDSHLILSSYKILFS